MLVSYGLIYFGFGEDAEWYYRVIQYLSLPIFLWFLLDALICFKSRNHRALHDFIAGTVVIRLDMVNEEPSDKKLNPPGPEEYADLTV